MVVFGSTVWLLELWQNSGMSYKKNTEGEVLPVVKLFKKSLFFCGRCNTGVPPASGFAHARNGRGCRQIKAVNATVLPRAALLMGKFYGCVRLSRKRQNRPYNVHLAQNFEY